MLWGQRRRQSIWNSGAQASRQKLEPHQSCLVGSSVQEERQLLLEKLPKTANVKEKNMASLFLCLSHFHPVPPKGWTQLEASSPGSLGKATWKSLDPWGTQQSRGTGEMLQKTDRLRIHTQAPSTSPSSVSPLPASPSCHLTNRL